MPAVPQAGQLARAGPPAPEPRSAGRSGTAGHRRAPAPRASGRPQSAEASWAGASWAGRVPQRRVGAHPAVAVPLPSVEAQEVGTGTGRAAPWDRRQTQSTTEAIAARPGRPPPSPSQRTDGAAVADRSGAARAPAARRVRRRCPRYPSAFLAPWPDLPTTHTQLPAAPHGPHSRHVTARRTGPAVGAPSGPVTASPLQPHRLSIPAPSALRHRPTRPVAPHAPSRHRSSRVPGLPRGSAGWTRRMLASHGARFRDASAHSRDAPLYGTDAGRCRPVLAPYHHPDAL